MRFKKYLKERRSSMTKHFQVPKGMTVKKVHSDKKGDVWLNKKHKAGNIFGKGKYKIASWFQNNEIVIAKLKKINEEYIKEVKWKKIPIRRTTGRRDVWSYDKYELHKETDGTFTMYDITQKGDRPNSYRVVGTFDSLKNAKDGINEYSGGSPVSQLMYGAYGAETRRAPKTGVSRDFTRRGYGKNISGIAAPIEVYYDELSPQNIKKKRKRNWLSSNSRRLL